MKTTPSNKEEVERAIDEAVTQLLNLIAPLDENQFNTVPYPGSWTAGQLCRHVAKSTIGIAKAMEMAAKPAERDPGERIPELKRTFLDFSIQMNSPEFIVPEAGPYAKQTLTGELNHSFNSLKERANHANLSAIVDGSPLGAITNWEMLHFVLYHTQRHVHQLKKITAALTNQQRLPE